MKNILIIIVFISYPFLSIAQDKEINWMTMNEALAEQVKNPKKIMMDAYTNWCGPCKLLDKKTFRNADVVKYVNENYYAVKFNAEGNESIKYKDETFVNPNYNDSRANSRNSQHQLTEALQINAYPTIVFFNESGNILVPLPGYKTPQQLELYLKLFLNNSHESITTQEEWSAYQKEFKSEFKG
jgi:thioredoxin-related protein